MSFFSNILNAASSALGEIPVVGGFLGSLAGGTAADMQIKDEREWNAGQSQINRDFQTSEREAAQEFNLEMWNMNNEYNDPTEVLKRNMAAGYNPNAVLSGGQIGSVAKPVTTSPMPGNVASPASSIASTLLTRDAVVNNLLAQAKKTSTDADLNKQTLQWNEIEIPQRIKSMEKTFEKLDAETKAIFSDTKIRQDTFNILASKSEEEIKILKEQANEVIAKVKLLNKQSSNEDKRGELLDAQTNLTNNQSSIEALKVKFSEESGVPYGTDVFESIWKTIVNGEFSIVVDKLLSGVVGTLSLAPKIAKKASEIVIEQGKQGFRSIQNMFGTETPPTSFRNP